jgi:NADPH2:quinone reductase
MKAIDTIDQSLCIIESPLPEIKADHIVVKTIAAGLNRADILQRRGLYPPPKGEPEILGLEISGTRTDTNEIICALLSGGGYAEFVSVHKELCLPVPKHLDPIHAAGLPEAIFTVYRNLVEIGGLKKHDHVLIHGGASGIGTMAIQIAKYLGARVTVTAGSDDRCAKCVALGADIAINYKSQSFDSLIAKQSIDIALDMVGGETLSKTISLMNHKGRIISIAYLENAFSTISIPIIMKQQLTITGSTLRDQSLEYKIELARKIKRDIWPAVMDGTIRPVIDRIFDLNDAQKAHHYFETGGHFGKILLKSQ